MRESIRRALSVVMVFAIVGAGTVAFVNLDQGPEPVQQYGAVEDGEAVIVSGTVLAGAGIALVAGGAGLAAGAYYSEDIPEEQLNDADDVETHTAIYQAAAQGRQNSNLTTTAYDNWMQDAGMIGRMEGQNAYIRYLNNNSGATKTAALTNGTNQIDEWFAARQKSLLNRWETKMTSWGSYYDRALNETNQSYARSMWSYTGWDKFGEVKSGYEARSLASNGPVSQPSVTLANGTSITVDALRIDAPASSSDGYALSPWGTNFNNGTVYKTGVSGSELDKTTWLNVTGFKQSWETTEAKHQEAINELNNFVDATYSGYQAGDIDSSDLITPSLADRNYSPDGDTGTFTQSALTRMGYSLPTDFSGTKTMSLRADGGNYTGIMLSDGLPAGGEWEIGKEYLVANIPGEQLIQTSDEMLEIEDNVTILSVQQTDGSTKDSGVVTYTNPDYETTSISGYKDLMQNITEMQAQINARQQALRNDSGGGTGGLFAGAGDLIPGLNGIQTAVALFVALMVSIMLVGMATRS